MQQRAALVVAVLTAHLLFYTLIIGGDHFEYRVLSHLIPIGFASLPWLTARVWKAPAFVLGSLVAMHHEMGVKEKRRVVNGNTVVVEYEYVGTINGTALGQSVGKEGCPDLDYALPTTSWYTIENGKIAHQRDFIDWASYLELRETLLAAGSGS